MATVKVRQIKQQKTFTADMAGFKDYVSQFTVFSEREKELKLLMYASLMKEHVLLRGLPGTAKSLLAKQFLGNITGSKVFSMAFNAFMDDSYVFGPQLLEEFKKGNVVHNTKDSLVDSNFAFLDEFFEANEQVLTSCNEVLNERTFTRNAQKESSPLVTAVMTTNRDRESEKNLEAVFDRVIFKSRVLKVSDDEARINMYKNAMRGSLIQFSPYKFSDLETIHANIEDATINFSIGILNCYSLLIREYEQQSNKIISDRTAVKGLRLLKIVALLAGRKDVTFQDFRELGHIFCTQNEAKDETVFDACYTRTEKEFAKIESELKALDEMSDAYDALLEAHKVSKGYRDYKALYAASTSLSTKIKELVPSITNGDTQNQLAERMRNVDEIAELADTEVKKFRAKGGDKDEGEDTSWFDELTKKGKS